MIHITEEKILAILSRVQDPELPVNIVDLGLIYGIHVDETGVRVQMTLTTPGCPMHSTIRKRAEEELTAEGIEDAEIEIVWDPPWSRDMVTPAGRKKLGWRE